MTARPLPEYAVANLARLLERLGERQQAERVWAVYDRIIMPARGPEPTDAELEELALEVAPGWQFDHERLMWQPRNARGAS